MSRFPPIPAAELQGEQRETYDELKAMVGGFFSKAGFVWMRESDGALVGPFATFLYLPKSVSIHFFKCAEGLAKVPNFPANARETAILATGEHFGAQYEMYAHRHVAINSGALTEAQVQDIVSGRRPRDCDEKATVAWEVSRALCSTKGPLDEQLYRKGVSCFGREGMAGLVNYVGSYAWTSILLNAADEPVPE